QGSLSDRGSGPCRIDGGREEIALAGLRDRRKPVECRLAAPWIALLPEALELLDLARPHDGIVDLQSIDRSLASGAVFVNADHRLLARIDQRLGACGSFLYPYLRQALLDRRGHATHRLHFRDMARGAR